MSLRQGRRLSAFPVVPAINGIHQDDAVIDKNACNTRVKP